MTDPSFLLNSSAAKDLVELARDLQALVDSRTAAQADPLSGFGLDFDLREYNGQPAASTA